MAQRSVLYQLVEDRLPGTLADYVAQHRTNGTSWRVMAADLSERTGVQVTHQTLANWFGSRIQTTVVVSDRPGGAA